MDYQPVIGLEIHTELKTKTKMFCSCKNDSSDPHPNINICPICLGHPGTLPVINKETLFMVIKTGLALNCKVRDETYFERKNYFYPDLPKGYQISQYKAPICQNGHLDISSNRRQRPNKIGIQRIHLEEDTARLIHPEGENYSLVDFNRSGIPLMELVTQPDISSAEEARKFAQELQLILRYLEVSDADMEKGQMRVEVNISLTPITTGQSRKVKLGTKVEIKNLNSFLAVEKAIKYEIKRQQGILNRGGKINQETRGWEDVKGETQAQRVKEESQDYRYFPEPDLPPLQLTTYRSQIIKTMSELPQQRRERFKNEYKLSDKEVETLIKDKTFSDYFEKVILEIKKWQKTERLTRPKLLLLIKLAVNYLKTDLLGLMKEKKKIVRDLKIKPENFAELIIIIWKKEVSSKAGKIILREMFKTGTKPAYIVQKRELKQVSDKKKIRGVVEKIIKENPQPVDDYKKGKKNALQFLIGKVMRDTKGRVDPKIAHKIIQEILTSSSKGA